VKTIADVSNAGRAPKNDAALFALAMACGAHAPAPHPPSAASAASGCLPAPCARRPPRRAPTPQAPAPPTAWSSRESIQFSRSSMVAARNLSNRLALRGDRRGRTRAPGWHVGCFEDGHDALLLLPSSSSSTASSAPSARRGEQRRRRPRALRLRPRPPRWRSVFRVDDV
jgi:hypothetical protein